jgi:hypothetical protein
MSILVVICLMFFGGGASRAAGSILDQVVNRNLY